MRIKCNNCEWEGDEKELVMLPNRDDGDLAEHCPSCHREDCLMDMENQKGDAK